MTEWKNAKAISNAYQRFGVVADLQIVRIATRI